MTQAAFSGSALKSILVYVDNTDQAAACARAALDIAQVHDAHVAGLGVQTPIYIPAFAAAQVPADVYEALAQRQQADLDSAKGRFDEALQDAGWTDRASWQAIQGEPAQVIARQGLFNDLIVIRQEDPEKDPAAYEGLPDEVVLHAGRPVLILPYIGARDTVAKRVMVAWSGTRESARAIGDALPFMQVADEIKVVTVDPDGEDAVPGSDVARYLSAHGIHAQLQTLQSDGLEVGDVILNQAADDGMDLVVMGGYGHSRVREVILGGVTHHLLGHMTVPVLMSH